MRKSVPFGTKPGQANVSPDDWVSGAAAGATPSATAAAPPALTEPMKRFTIDVPRSLHSRIKSQCALRGLNMADVIRGLLEEQFPATSGEDRT